MNFPFKKGKKNFIVKIFIKFSDYVHSLNQRTIIHRVDKNFYIFGKHWWLGKTPQKNYSIIFSVSKSIKFFHLLFQHIKIFSIFWNPWKNNHTIFKTSKIISLRMDHCSLLQYSIHHSSFEHAHRSNIPKLKKFQFLLPSPQPFPTPYTPRYP